MIGFILMLILLSNLLSFIYIKMLKTIITLILLMTLVASTVIPRTSPIISHTPLVYKVQISDDPKTRWSKIIPDFI